MCLAVPGKVMKLVEGAEGGERVAEVDFQGSTMQISLDFLPEAGVGDWVLVHAGYAINTLDEEEAREVWDYLEEFEEASAEAAKSFGMENIADG